MLFIERLNAVCYVMWFVRLFAFQKKMISRVFYHINFKFQLNHALAFMMLTCFWLFLFFKVAKRCIDVCIFNFGKHLIDKNLLWHLLTFENINDLISQKESCYNLVVVVVVFIILSIFLSWLIANKDTKGK